MTSRLTNYVQFRHCNYCDLCDAPIVAVAQGMPDLIWLPNCGSVADVVVHQTVDGKDREELLALQQRLESKIQVCLGASLALWGLADSGIEVIAPSIDMIELM